MYTIADIYNMAIQIERNGEAEYKKAAEQTDSPEMKKLFTNLAKDEAEHAKWFTNLLKKTSSRNFNDTELNEISAKLLQDIIRDAKFPIEGKELDEIIDPAEALQFSIALEEDTIAFYQFLSDLVEDSDIRNDIQQIIEEEKTHAKKLRKAAKKYLPKQ